jgi:catechol 2,3-dioxygenase-like lactoylglutathione lyase family enzyme
MTRMSVSLNHVGVIVDDLEQSISFYEDLFGLELLPAPAFNVPVAWLRAGELQVHLTERSGPHSGHFALSTDDLGAVYRRALEAGVLARDAGGHAVYVLPSGEIQLYVLDPSGNVVEVNHHDAERWRDEIPEMVPRADLVAQPADAPAATLFLSRFSG